MKKFFLKLLISSVAVLNLGEPLLASKETPEDSLRRISCRPSMSTGSSEAHNDISVSQGTSSPQVASEAQQEEHQGNILLSLPGEQALFANATEDISFSEKEHLKLGETLFKEIGDNEPLKSFCILNLQGGLEDFSLMQTKDNSSEETPSLQFLDLSQLGINRQTALRVSMRLRDSLGSIKAIDFSRNEIDDLVTWTLSRTLSYHPQVTDLNFSTNRIGNKGASYLSKLVHLKSLNLSHNYIEIEGAVALLEGLRPSATLTDLNLENNPIKKDEKLERLVKELRTKIRF